MTDGDLFPFMETFRSVSRVFPLRGEEHELTDIGRSYFKALRRFSLTQVKAGADVCIQQLTRFPKPQEWASRVPQFQPTSPLPQLSVLEQSEWLDAERRGYENDPCGCRLCREVGVDHRPIRFVPDEPHAAAMLSDRKVLRGHWAHGDELVRWYRAKEEFYTKLRALSRTHTMTGPKKKYTVRERIEQVFHRTTTREPGEEG